MIVLKPEKRFSLSIGRRFLFVVADAALDERVTEIMNAQQPRA